MAHTTSESRNVGDVPVSLMAAGALLEHLGRSNSARSSLAGRIRAKRKDSVLCDICQRLVEYAAEAKQPWSMRKRFAFAFHGSPTIGPFGPSLDTSKLRDKASSCGFCGVLLSILGGPDGINLHQAMIYNNPAYNQFQMYDENGISDPNAYGKKTYYRFRARIANEFDESYNSRMVLNLELEISLRTQAATARREHDSVVARHLDIFKTTGPLILPFDHRLDPLGKTSWIRGLLRGQQLHPHEHLPRTTPTRLLDLTNKARLRVVKSDTIQSLNERTSHVRYVALNHRWGASQHLTLTESNLVQLRDGFHVETLPGTFRDAVFFAQHLGFRYLWIDALCIVQDSTSDWLQESQIMGDIFMNAKVTFAIHCAEDDAEGFCNARFRDVTQYSIKSTILKCTCASPRIRNMTSQTADSHGEDGYGFSFNSATSHSLISQPLPATGITRACPF